MIIQKIKGAPLAGSTNRLHMENSNKSGRPKGRPNNLKKESKVDLAAFIKPEMENLRKHLVSGVPFEQRAKLLLEYAKLLLPKGVPISKAAEEIRDIICRELKPEFHKLFAYNRHQSGTKQQKLLIEALKLLTTEQQRDTIN